MYPADDAEARLRILLSQLRAARERLRQEVERSRSLRSWIRTTSLSHPPRPD